MRPRRPFVLILLVWCFVFCLPRIAPAWFDDFNDGESEGWTENFRNMKGEWDVVDGVYEVSGATGNCSAVAGDIAWENYTLEVKGMVAGDTDPGFYQLQVMVFAQDKKNFYLFSYHAQKGSQWWSHVNGAAKNTPENDKKLAEAGVWYNIRIESEGDTLSAYVNDELVAVIEDVKLKNGMVGLATYACHSCYDDVWVYGPGIDRSPGEPGAVEAEGKLITTWATLKEQVQ